MEHAYLSPTLPFGMIFVARKSSVASLAWGTYHSTSLQLYVKTRAISCRCLGNYHIL